MKIIITHLLLIVSAFCYCQTEEENQENYCSEKNLSDVIETEYANALATHGVDHRRKSAYI